MKTSRFVVWSVPALLAPLAFIHCSGGDAGSVGGDAGHKNDSSVSGGSGSGGGSGGSSGASSGVNGDDGSSGSPGASSGAALDGSGGGDTGQVVVPAIPVPDGGAPSDPGSVECNGAACPVSTNYCCNNFTDGGQSCNASNAGCSVIKQACNESSDCAAGNVCCQTINGVGVPGDTACYAGACPGPGTTTFQICRTDGECGADAGPLQRCIPQTCTNPTPGSHASFKIEACAVAPTYPYNPGPALYGCVAN